MRPPSRRYLLTYLCVTSLIFLYLGRTQHPHQSPVRASVMSASLTRPKATTSPAPTPHIPSSPKLSGWRKQTPKPVAKPVTLAPASTGTTEHCIASHYGYDYRGVPMSAAHKTAPKGSHLRVSYGGRSVVVVVNDRGPYVAGRCVDLARTAFSRLASPSAGTIPVTVEHLH